MEGQIEVLYERLQPPIKVLKALKMVLERRNQKRLDKAKLKVVNLRRLISNTESKALNIADQLAERNIEPETYKQLYARYTETIRIAQEELSFLEQSISDGLDFLDKCMAISSCLFRLHKSFNLE